MPPRAEEKNRVLADRSISNCDIMCKNLKSYTLLTDKIGVKSWQSCWKNDLKIQIKTNCRERGGDMGVMRPWQRQGRA